MDTLDSFIRARPPTAARPLLGLTILLVEDSRYSAEAFRLLSLRSGARIRRADSLQAARKHLRVYCPTAAIIDVGLPDGSGLLLIEELAQACPRVEILLATSGDPDVEDAAIKAGADGFLEKPIGNIGAFQSAILRHLPADRQPSGPRAVRDGEVTPDPIAFRDDLEHALRMLESERTVGTVSYVAQFVGGVARSAGDPKLVDLADTVRRDFASEAPDPVVAAAALEQTLQQRISTTPSF